ncbi:MAG: leucyl aminopeptidase [Anaerolineaceae bacterium]|nr:leucyl aminopeptidase [Anaerolineaceae bacterium]
MDIKAVQGEIQNSDADAIIVNLFEGAAVSGATQAVDTALGGAISDLIASGDFTGKDGQTGVIYPRGVIPARRVILVGLGTQADFSVEAVRRAAATAVKKAGELKAKQAATVLHGAGAGGLDVRVAAQAVSEGSLLASYRYHGQKTSDAPENLPESLGIIAFDAGDVPAVEAGIRDGSAIAAGVMLARDLGNLPPNICTPEYMAQTARTLAESTGLRCEVLEKAQMQALKMGAHLAVAQGSDTPPRFIILEHNAERASELPTLVLIGKGVTFDTGGYSLKPGEGMATMKNDMSGAAAVIGAMGAIAGLDVPLHVVGLAPAADNMINGHAYRPQEVITASNGVTIEIISTDAEGRMLLADALVYAGRYQPDAVVDIATLTGACVVALGAGVSAGVFSTDDTLRDHIQAASAATGEKVWPLPLFPDYEKAIESQTADIKNSGGRTGGVGTSAIFLKHFVDYPVWAHVDMAGMAINVPDIPYVPAQGSSGYGVRLLTALAQQMAAR